MARTKQTAQKREEARNKIKMSHGAKKRDVMIIPEDDDNERYDDQEEEDDEEEDSGEDEAVTVEVLDFHVYNLS